VLLKPPGDVRVKIVRETLITNKYNCKRTLVDTCGYNGPAESLHTERAELDRPQPIPHGQDGL
jgi:hypothetical protein